MAVARTIRRNANGKQVSLCMFFVRLCLYQYALCLGVDNDLILQSCKSVDVSLTYVFVCLFLSASLVSLFCLYVCKSVRLSSSLPVSVTVIVSVHIFLFTSPSVSLSLCLCLFLSLCLCLCLSVCLPTCRPVCLSVC